MKPHRMNCDHWRSGLMELARGHLSDAGERDGVAAHARECSDCSLFLEEQMALTIAAAELAARTAMVPPADLESILLAEFDSARLRRRRYLKPAAAIGAIAAALACFAVLHVPPQRARSQPVVIHVAPVKETVVSPPVAVMPLRKPVPRPVRRAHAAKPTEDAGPFVAIPYTVPLDPRERMTVMRVEMPVTALLAVGLTAAVPDPGASAQADVVVGEDGRIRAIRLVSFFSSASDTNRRIKQ
jgi:hypothetical protein